MFVKGRQETGYEKKKLWQFWRCDGYILRYQQGSYIPKHTDPVANRKHWRLNYELWKPEEGGIFQAHGKCYTFGRLHVFRSDDVPHEVSEIKLGVRYVLSIGVAL